MYKVLPLFPDGFSPSCIEECIQHSGKLEVLGSMLNYIFTKTSEKIVIVSNYTQVRICIHVLYIYV